MLFGSWEPSGWTMCETGSLGDGLGTVISHFSEGLSRIRRSWVKCKCRFVDLGLCIEDRVGLGRDLESGSQVFMC